MRSNVGVCDLITINYLINIFVKQYRLSFYFLSLQTSRLQTDSQNVYITSTHKVEIFRHNQCTFTIAALLGLGMAGIPYTDDLRFFFSNFLLYVLF